MEDYLYCLGAAIKYLKQAANLAKPTTFKKLLTAITILDEVFSEASGGLDYFAIDDTDPDCNPDCALLHNNDVLHCYNCDYETTGRVFVNKLKKKQGLIKCPHCKGKGVVKQQ